MAPKPPTGPADPIRAADAALYLHADLRQLDPTDSPALPLWHLLMSLVEYADQHGINLAAQLRTVCEEYQVCTEKPLPAWAAPFLRLPHAG